MRIINPKTYLDDLWYILDIMIREIVVLWLQVSIHSIFPLVHSQKQPLTKQTAREDSLFQPFQKLTEANSKKLVVN